MTVDLQKSLMHRLRRGTGHAVMRKELVPFCKEVTKELMTAAPFYVVLSGTQGSGKSLVVQKAVEQMRELYGACFIVVSLTQQDTVLRIALQSLRRQLSRALLLKFTGVESQLENKAFVEGFANSPTKDLAGLLFEVDQVDVFLEKGREVLEFLTSLASSACRASSAIKAGVIGMTNTDMQLLEPVKHFSYVKCTIPWGAGYGSAHVHNAQMQIFSSMLTAPAHQPRSECHYAQISTLLEQSAVKEALEAIIKQGNMVPGRLANACEHILPKGSVPSTQAILDGLNVACVDDPPVQKMHRSFMDFLMLLAVWHATNDCKRPTTFDVLMPYYGKVVTRVLACTQSTIIKEGLLNQQRMEASFDMLLEKGYIRLEIG
ncbi:hypothetical protein ABBQ38_013217 [Trebouxia sp. C0009 RCD-2024]